MSANKRGYINVAVDLGLANGLDGNRFDPQGAVTRAQLATFSVVLKLTIRLNTTTRYQERSVN